MPQFSGSVLTFDNSPVIKTTHIKHLGLILDQKLNFNEHLKHKMSNSYKGMSVHGSIQNIIPKNNNYKYLLTIYKWNSGNGSDLSVIFLFFLFFQNTIFGNGFPRDYIK